MSMFQQSCEVSIALDDRSMLSIKYRKIILRLITVALASFNADEIRQHILL